MKLPISSRSPQLSRQPLEEFIENPKRKKKKESQARQKKNKTKYKKRERKKKRKITAIYQIRLNFTPILSSTPPSIRGDHWDPH